MKAVSVEKIAESIRYYDSCITKQKELIDGVIRVNATKINLIIEKKIEALSEELKQSAIEEVCGKEISEYNLNIEGYALKKNALEALLEDSVEVNGESALEDENALETPNAAVETTNPQEV